VPVSLVTVFGALALLAAIVALVWFSARTNIYYSIGGTRPWGRWPNAVGPAESAVGEQVRLRSREKVIGRNPDESLNLSGLLVSRSVQRNSFMCYLFESWPPERRQLALFVEPANVNVDPVAWALSSGAEIEVAASTDVSNTAMPGRPDGFPVILSLDKTDNGSRT
jgi:hypothetical protein